MDGVDVSLTISRSDVAGNVMAGSGAGEAGGTTGGVDGVVGGGGGAVGGTAGGAGFRSKASFYPKVRCVHNILNQETRWLFSSAILTHEAFVGPTHSFDI